MTGYSSLLKKILTYFHALVRPLHLIFLCIIQIKSLKYWIQMMREALDLFHMELGE